MAIWPGVKSVYNGGKFCSPTNLVFTSRIDRKSESLQEKGEKEKDIFISSSSRERERDSHRSIYILGGFAYTGKTNLHLIEGYLTVQ